MQVAQTKFAAGGSQSTGSYDLGPAIVKTRKTLTAKQQAEADLASGISPEAPVSSKSTVTGAIEGESRGAYAVRVSKSDFNMNRTKTRIAGEDVGEKLSDKQMAVMEMGKASGNKYSPEIEAKYAEQRKSVGAEVAQTSTENADMTREASGKGGANNTVVSNNVSSNNTTKIVPMKASPRPEYTGSALDRYTSRIAVY